MLRKLSYVFMILAVILTVSHNITAHDHHVVREIEHDEHDDDGDDDHSAHTFFSYGHLEDSFVNSKTDVTLSHDAQTPDFFIASFPEIKFVETFANSFRPVNDPPSLYQGHFCFRSLRAPPVC